MEPDRPEIFENPEEGMIAVGSDSGEEGAQAAPSATEVNPSSSLSRPAATEEKEKTPHQSADPQPPSFDTTLLAVLEHLAEICSRMDFLQKDFESKIF